MINFRLAALAVLGLVVCLPAAAQGSYWSPEQARDAVRDGKNVPLQRIFANLQQRYGGMQRGAVLRGGNTYEIEWQTGDGRILQIEADAQTGAVRNVRSGNGERR